jgi:hypothetical protein
MLTVQISLRDSRKAEEVFRDLGLTELPTVQQVASDYYEVDGGEMEEEDIQEWFVEAVGMFGIEAIVRSNGKLIYSSLN